MNKLLLLLCLGAHYAVAGEAAVRQEIISLLEAFPKNFNEKHLTEVCDLFSLDVVAIYPGTEDRSHAALCDNFKNIFAEAHKKFSYDKPHIEQMIIKEDLAVVRLIWTLHVTYKNETETIQEKGVDVFKRQPDGRWKIVISSAYPLPQGDR